MKRTKSFLIASLIASVTFYSVPPVFATQQPVSVSETSKTISIYIGDKKIQFDVPPFIKQDSFNQKHVMVPLEPIVEALGGKVEVRKTANGSIIDVTKDSMKISLIEGQNTQYVQGYMVDSKAEPVTIDSRLFVPLKFLGTALGAEIQSDATDSKITLQLISNKGESVKGKKGFIQEVYSIKNYDSKTEITVLSVLGDDMQQYRLLTDKKFEEEQAKGKMIVFDGEPDQVFKRYTLLNDSEGGDVIKVLKASTIQEFKTDLDSEIEPVQFKGKFTRFLGNQGGAYLYAFQTNEGTPYTVAWSLGTTKYLSEGGPNVSQFSGYGASVSGYKKKSSNVVILKEIAEVEYPNYTDGRYARFDSVTLVNREENRPNLQVYKGIDDITKDEDMQNDMHVIFDESTMPFGYTNNDLTDKEIYWSGINSEPGKVIINDWFLYTPYMNEYGTIVSVKEQDNNRVVYTLKPQYSSFTEITFNRTVLGNKYPEASLVGKKVVVSGEALSEDLTKMNVRDWVQLSQ